MTIVAIVLYALGIALASAFMDFVIGFMVLEGGQEIRSMSRTARKLAGVLLSCLWPIVAIVVVCRPLTASSRSRGRA